MKAHCITYPLSALDINSEAIAILVASSPGRRRLNKNVLCGSAPPVVPCLLFFRLSCWLFLVGVGPVAQHEDTKLFLVLH
jgi:hypothetical protein